MLDALLLFSRKLLFQLTLTLRLDTAALGHRFARLSELRRQHLN